MICLHFNDLMVETEPKIESVDDSIVEEREMRGKDEPKAEREQSLSVVASYTTSTSAARSVGINEGKDQLRYRKTSIH
jgi:hypothetical protein